jgi:hypothetical protein
MPIVAPKQQAEKPLQLLKTFERSVEAQMLSPQEFLEKHPFVNRGQLARYAGCSIATVHRWFVKTSYRVEPNPLHCLRLGLADRFLREIYKK